MSQEHRPFTIAIAGAGIAGLALAIALKDLPGVRVDIYERAAQLREIGASIALSPNGMRTLDRLGVHNALVDTADDPENGVSFRNASGLPMVYRHYLTGEVVSSDPSQSERGLDRRHWTARFYRAHLQESLAAHVDPRSVHLSKTFAGVVWDAVARHLLLSFADGTTATADLLVGADGLHSRVRTFFVPTSRPSWTGALALRSVFSRSHVAHIKDLPHEATHVWGPEHTLFFSPLGRDLYTVVGQLQLDPDEDPDDSLDNGSYPRLTSSRTDVDIRNTAAAWASQGNVETLRRLYSTWGPLFQDLLAAVPHTQLYPNSSTDSLPTWLLSTATVPPGRVTLIGDAAHAHGGAFATGGSLALDDAWALAAALREVVPALSETSASGNVAPKALDTDLVQALQLYEATRKAHTDRLLQLVHAANTARVARLRDSKRAAAGPETDEQLLKRIRGRADVTWLYEHDVTAAFSDALQELRKSHKQAERTQHPITQSRI
ncbi:hypothetical protein SEPCBS119000_003149 [Sporothrix epigloea]|uniref:FAD-binding domain-containing protein n=1 Tax=Sporothrix epigloea TaxID=1892477 RepID=A0ABP0DK96_9PEZI